MHISLAGLLFLLLLLPSSTQAQPATLSGRVVEADSGLPLPGVNVVVETGTRGTVSDADGHFAIERLTPDVYTLRFSAVGYRTVRRTDIRLGELDLDLGDIAMEIQTLNMDEIVVSPGRFAIMSVGLASQQTLSERDLKNMSWSEDITRAVTRLPGISSSDFSSKFTIRGGEADEVLITLDGMELYEPFHQRDKAGGLFSIVDIEAVRGVDLMTGGFPAEFGNRMSGVFAMQSRVPQGLRRTTLGVSLMNARAYTEGTFAGGRGSYLASARRGMLDLTFKLVPDAEIVPKFHDALVKVEYRLSANQTASIHVLEAGDTASVDDVDELGNGDRNRTSYRNLYGWATLKSVFGPALFARTLIYSGLVSHDRQGFFHKYEPSDKGDFLLRDQRDYAFYGVKQDWNWNATGRLALSTGFDARQARAVYDYDIDQSELRVAPDRALFQYTRQQTVHLEPSGLQLGAYLSARLRIGERLVVEPGLRYDHTGYAREDNVSPRVGVALALADRTLLRVATGRYYQAQLATALDVNNGQTTFAPAQLATHYVAGIEHETRRGINLRLEAYYKDLSHLTPNWTNLRDHQEVFPEQRNDNAQIVLDGARAQGVELFVKYDQGGRFSWWVSYALARAEDNVREIVFDGPLEKRTGWVPRLNNQTHSVYADLNYRLNQKWHFAFSFKFYNGWPRTDYTYDYVFLDNGDYHFFPVEGRYNGTPYPAYHRLDARANRRFQTAHGEVIAYLQVLNLYNRENLRKFDLDTRNDDEEYSLDAQGNYVPFEDHLFWFGLTPVFGVSWTF